MMKKSLILGVFLMFFSSGVAVAEEVKESSLTLRQGILLGVPDGAEIALNEVVWAVDQEKHLEVLTVIRQDAIDVIHILGDKVFDFVRIAFVPQPGIGFGFLPTLAGLADENGILQVSASSPLFDDMNEMTEDQVRNAITESVNSALKALEIETDRKLAEFIRKNFRKAAVTP